MPEQKRHYTKHNLEVKPTEAENTPILDYEVEYNKAIKELNIAQNKSAEYEKIINAYAQQAKDAQVQLQKAMLEYNSRCEYMLDAVKHAYISIQLAYKNTKGEKND